MITEHSSLRDDKTNAICGWDMAILRKLGHFSGLQFWELRRCNLARQTYHLFQLSTVKVSNPLSRFFGPQCNVALFQEALRFHGHYKIQPQLHCSTHKSCWKPWRDHLTKHLNGISRATGSQRFPAPNIDGILWSNIIYIVDTQIIITTSIWWLLQLGSCCAAVQRSRIIVPIFIFSPVHHFHEELHQLLLVLQVGVSSQVLDDSYYLHCLWKLYPKVQILMYPLNGAVRSCWWQCCSCW